MFNALALMFTNIGQFFLRAFIATCLWAWFVVPLGEHIAYINIPVAMGLIVTYSLMFGKVPELRTIYPDPAVPKTKVTNNERWCYLFTKTTAWLIIWGFAAVIHLFI